LTTEKEIKVINEKNPFNDSTIVYGSKGWKEKIRKCWIYNKLLNMDFSGMGYSQAFKYAKEFGFNDFGNAFCFRGLVPGKCHHAKVELYEPDNFDVEGIATKYTSLIKEIEEAMPKVKTLVLGFGWEHRDLSDSNITREITLVKENE